ncbi:MBL fold metallo-hydrolase [Agathobaculum butyriciproducens]|nr:MBL fold metallo-hydrolase [Agathobaculum butyriciproducens]
MAEHYYYSIASGSSGNCGLYMADGTAILIDLGVSLRRITTALKALSLTLEDISAVVLTHEHIDHVKGLPMFLKKARRRCLPPAAQPRLSRKRIRSTPTV